MFETEKISTTEIFLSPKNFYDLPKSEIVICSFKDKRALNFLKHGGKAKMGGKNKMIDDRKTATEKLVQNWRSRLAMECPEQTEKYSTTEIFSNKKIFLVTNCCIFLNASIKINKLEIF
ncbi:hypothetical protein [Nostoc sp. 106C]|uniref:hypothetical protein n=1 Tax=Nostoc sp. 106C TaxID=1932667 RepID=UPI000A3B5507|nr:hypothetical protein [Nostoc sp. 106C]OUL30737.1 hypothetical protein BV375_13595 [Nostoc sp. 106C]